MISSTSCIYHKMWDEAMAIKHKDIQIFLLATNGQYCMYSKGKINRKNRIIIF